MLKLVNEEFDSVVGSSRGEFSGTVSMYALYENTILPTTVSVISSAGNGIICVGE
jgi:hypothetical protein